MRKCWKFEVFGKIGVGNLKFLSKYLCLEVGSLNSYNIYKYNHGVCKIAPSMRSSHFTIMGMVCDIMGSVRGSTIMSAP